jgi:hypothetical protein
MSGKLQAIPGSGIVEQAKIDCLIGLGNQIRQMTAIYNEEAAALRERLEAGAEVEPGVHTAELEQVTEGGVRTVRLVLH